MFTVSGFVLVYAGEFLSQKKKIKWKVWNCPIGVIYITTKSVIKSQKLPAMVLCFGEPPVRFLCCCCSFLMCFFICRCSFHSFPGYFTMSLALHPGFSGLWNPPPALSSTPTTFDGLFFFIFRECYGIEEAFFTHRRFYLTLLPEIFGTTCFYQCFPRNRQLFLNICIAWY